MLKSCALQNGTKTQTHTHKVPSCVQKLNSYLALKLNQALNMMRWNGVDTETYMKPGTLQQLTGKHPDPAPAPAPAAAALLIICRWRNFTTTYSVLNKINPSPFTFLLAKTLI